MKKYGKAINAAIVFAIALIPFSASAQSPQPDPPPNTSANKSALSYRLTTMTGETVDNTMNADKVVILVYIVARQRGSELAIVDASQIVKDLKGKPVQLLLVTANEEHRSYFEQFWESESIEAPLAFDPDRELYAKLKLIAFPSTFVIDPKGQLIHKIPTHGSSYLNDLDGYTRFALGMLDDAGLAEHLKARHLPLDSTKSLASRHRTVARLMREKGYMDAAEKELLVALELDPESVDVRLDIADLYLYLKRFDEASSLIDEILEIDSKHRRVLLLKGILLFRKNKLDEAQKLLTQVLTLNPDPARTHFYLGRVYESQGEKDKALEHYRDALGRLLNEPTD